MEDLRALAKRLGNPGQEKVFLAEQKYSCYEKPNKAVPLHEGRKTALSSTAPEHRTDWGRRAGRKMADGLDTIHDRAVQGGAPDISMDTGFD